jgi:thiol:disulfide interchange protein DsbC
MKSTHSLSSWGQKLTLSFCLAAGVLSMVPSSARADEAQIRENLGKRIPGMPAIDEIRKTPMSGIYELRIGKELAYTDAKGDFLFRGSFLSTADTKDLTAQRMEEILRISFKDLPLNNAIVTKNGSGKMKMAIFADPNCGFCKKLAKDMVGLKDVTVYTILVPILSQDSVDKAKSIWCSKDKGQAWDAWMLEGKSPAKASLVCATPTETNLEFAKKNDIHGTPTIFFEDGTRFTGAMPIDQMTAKLAKLYKK